MKKLINLVLIIALAAVLIVLLVYFGGKAGQAQPGGTGAVALNEVMTSNKGSVPDENGDYYDWVELYNGGSDAADISGFALSDSLLSGAKFVFPDNTVIKAGGYIVVYCCGENRQGLYANFKLSSTDDLIFMDSTGKVLDSITLRSVASGSTLGRDPADSQKWREFTRPSPGYPNTDEGAAAFEETLRGGEDIGLYINEFMASNETTIMDAFGVFSDWIELYNSNDEEMDLSGFGISDNLAQPRKYTLPKGTKVPAKGYLVIFCSGNDAVQDGEIHAPFSLRAYEEDVVLTAKNGKIIDSYSYSRQESDQSMARVPDGTGEFSQSATPTPGYPNTEQGRADFEAKNVLALGDLYISEMLGANYSFLKAEDGEFYDWIELHNASGQDVNLSGYSLTNNPKNPAKWIFPETTIPAGGYITVLASGNDVRDSQKKNLETNFNISADGDAVYFYDPDGKLLDRMRAGMFHADVSYGRNEDGSVMQYLTPTPGKANEAGKPGFAAKPVFSQQAGAYEGSVTVSIEAPEGSSVYYTLDGSEPDASDTPYSGPIAISKTTIMRARAVKDGFYNSDIATATYLIDSPHTVRVVSLVTEPANLWDSEIGIYARGNNAQDDDLQTGANFWKEWERPVHFDIIDENGKYEYDQDAIFRIFGAYSRAKEQKGLAVIARAGYGGSRINYPLFDNREFKDYKSFVLRASGQESTISRIRDVLITGLVGEHTDLVAQAYEQCVVYLNGEYWGVYNIKEKINKHYLAQHYGIEDPDTIDLLVGNGKIVSGSDADYKAMLEYAVSHDLSQKEHYDYISSLIDVENLAYYTAMQLYVGNSDTGNIKFWKAPGRKWQWITYDFCWAMNASINGMKGYQWDSFAKYFHEKGHGVANGFSNKLIKALMKNADFKKLFYQACADMANVVFTEENIINRVNELEANIDQEMVRDTELWSGMSHEGWKRSVNRLREFAQNRKAWFAYQFRTYFNESSDTCTKLFGADGSRPST